MSSSLISHSEDLSALVQHGYCIQIRGCYLLVEHIPYIKEDGNIAQASIVTSLDVLNDRISAPKDHTVWWTGEVPYTEDGCSMEEQLICSRWDEGYDLGENISVRMQWSRKPKDQRGTRGYLDYKEKIETYVDYVAGPADAKAPGVLSAALTGADPVLVAARTRFKYLNTGTYRYGTKGIDSRIEDEVIAVVGVGGSGSYIVDILMKTDVKEIHMYDDDMLEQHNAFRLAGAARLEEIQGTIPKVNWHKEQYERVRKCGVHANEHKMIGGSESIQLSKFSTVFIAVDELSSRRAIQLDCERAGVLHIAVGIGVDIEGENDDQLDGMVKVETQYSGGDKENHSVNENNDKMVENGVYGNIQTAELNMLSAALAIVEWKAKRGIYRSDRVDYGASVIYTTADGSIERTKTVNK